MAARALLRGRDHPQIGFVEAVSEGPVAVRLCAGGVAKTYEHTSPNEDAVGFVRGPGGVLVAVADGHGGCEAAETGLGRVLDHYGEAWTGADPGPSESDWAGLVDAVLLDAHAAVLRATASSPNTSARSTLAFALVRPGEDRVLTASLGDSHVFRVLPPDAQDVAEPGHECGGRFFLGGGSLDASSVGERALACVFPCSAGTALVLSSDGLSERGIGVAEPSLAVVEAVTAASDAPPDRRAEETSRVLVELACEAQRSQRAGDNIAVAVVWLAAG